MIDHWIGHHHSHRDSAVSQLPAGLKLGVALALGGGRYRPRAAAGLLVLLAVGVTTIAVLAR